MDDQYLDSLTRLERALIDMKKFNLWVMWVPIAMSLIISFSAMVGTAYVFSYRVDIIEKDIAIIKKNVSVDVNAMHKNALEHSKMLGRIRHLEGYHHKGDVRAHDTQYNSDIRIHDEQYKLE